MSESHPWGEIAVPVSDFNVRRVAEPTATPCYWAKNAQGECLFVLELNGEYSRAFRKEHPQIHGVSVDLRTTVPGTQHLVLTLEEQVNQDLFAGMCSTLASSLQRATDSASSLDIALKHIRRWKAFLSGRGGTRLSPEEVRGLYAELTFLGEVLARAASNESALNAWLGPERSHQDFIYGDVAVEIKSLAGTERSSVHISSEDQLESQQGDCYLRLYRLSELPEAAGAVNLNELVVSIGRKITDAEAIEILDRKLSAHRYVPLPDYDSPKFVVTGIRTFKVREGFPRIIRSQLHTGLSNVKYEIRLEAIAPFECDSKEVFEGV